jgi:UDP-glucuronate 4-epimerase
VSERAKRLEGLTMAGWPGGTLITGAAGFIGFSVARSILEDGGRVVGVDNLCDYYPVAVKEARLEELRRVGGDRFTFRQVDIRDRDGLNAIFVELRPARVCHLAAQAGVRYSISHPHAYEEANLAGYLNVLEAVRHHGKPRLVSASSSSVYGGNTKLPFSESDPVDTPVSLYAATKRANELMAHCYTHLYGMETVGLRFFTVYGPWGRPDMAMWIFAEKILRDEPIPVFNNGKMRRDFTFVADIVQGVRACLDSTTIGPYEIFNLGNHRMEELMDMIRHIEAAVGKKAILDMMPMQPGDVPASYADVALAGEKLNYVPTTDVAVGIGHFCEWLVARPELGEAVHQWRNAGTDNLE